MEDEKGLEKRLKSEMESLEEEGFYSPFIFDPNDGTVGFSIKKKLTEEGGRYSLIKVRLIKKEGSERKPLHVTAVYGRENEGGIVFRGLNEIRMTDPVDLSFRDEYFYNVNEREFYGGSKKISPSDIVRDIYGKHIRSTKPFRGLGLRLKMWLWKVVIKYIFFILSKLFYYLLLLISGDRYTYDPVFKKAGVATAGEEEQNIRDRGILVLQNIESKRFNLFGYDASRWSVVAYSFLHLLLYILNVWLLADVVSGWQIFGFLKSNFLTILYVVASLWLFEEALPKVLKLFIKSFSRLSFYALFKSIKL